MAFGSDATSVLERIESKLQGIYRLLELQSRPQLDAALRKIATTKERRKCWMLADGERKTDEIARLSGAAPRTVQLFFQEAERAGLVDTGRRGYPRKRYEIIPSDWNAEI